MSLDRPFPVPSEITPPAEIAAFEAHARAYAAQAKSDNSLRAYQSDWDDFVAWCQVKKARALPADVATVLAYLIDRSSSLKISTLQRRLVAIRESHKYAGYVLDTSGVAFRDSWRGLRRAKGAPPAKKAPVLIADLRRAVATLSSETLIGLRDRALLLVGFAAALRRSELASLAVSQESGLNFVAEDPEGLVITLGHSKTDQTHAGQTIGVPYGQFAETCPVRAYQAWVAASGISSGPAFRAINRHGHVASVALSDKAIVLIIQRTLEAAALAEGASPADARARARRFAGHSLRSGLATSAAANDAPGHAIQRQLRHRKFETTAGYIQSGQLFKKNAASLAGL